jgi:hypothetical protein
MLPNVKEALKGWTKRVQFTIIKKKVTDFEVQEDTVTSPKISAMMQPVTAQKLLLKPEGQRQWKWWSIWTDTKMKLQLDWTLKDNQGKTYRIMEFTDWKDSGYYAYELVEGPAL